MQKTRIRIKITLLVGLILLISNTSLVGLLLFNFNVALSGFEIPINGVLVEYYFNDNFEASLLVAGCIIDIIATGLGTYIVYLILGKLLYPLKKLTFHMQKADKGNLFAPLEVESNIREVDILISSFNSMNDKMKTMFDNQSHFASYVAHEFRTPLTIILTNLEVYKKQPDINPEEIINIISEQVNKLSKLVTVILNLVSITRQELNDLIPVNLVIDEVIDDTEEIAKKKNVKLSFQKEVNVQTLGNHDLLYQAFFNLIENAIKYNKAGGEVFINMSATQDKIFVTIEDTGKGIAQEDKDKIFDPFYRGEQKSNKDIKGNGVGLAFAKQVFDYHKGSLVLEDSNKGARFKVALYNYDAIIREGYL